MDTNDVIETIKYYDRMYYDVGHTDDLKEAIELLQHGEKFEKMWEEFKGRFGYGTMENNFSGRLGPIDDIMDNIKQKYFPKGGK